MVISPVIMCGDKVKNALALIYAFSAITFISVLIGSFVTKKLPYAVKITIYAFISSLVYIPVKLMAQQFFPAVINRTGIYFMLLAVNSLIMVQTETKFYRMKKGRMFFSLIFYILGFDVVMLITSVLRELIAYGTVYEKVVDADILISGIGMPFGGFIFLGLFCGLYRKIRLILRQRNGGKKNVSGN
ncbi:MAG: electron transport complex subunit E [Ruminococcus sp.]|nr:electron transport complex subunit E [Ruminococcus sp.]